MMCEILSFIKFLFFTKKNIKDKLYLLYVCFQLLEIKKLNVIVDDHTKLKIADPIRTLNARNLRPG